MEIEEAFVNYLTTEGATAAIIETRLYPLKLPQNPTYPAMTYRRVSEVSIMCHDGPGDLLTNRFQFDCYAETYEQVVTLGKALRRDLDGYQGRMGGEAGVDVAGVFFQNAVDDWGDAAEVYRVAVDFKFMWKESI